MQLDPSSAPTSKGNKRLIFAFSALVGLGVAVAVGLMLIARAPVGERSLVELSPGTERLPASVDAVAFIASPLAMGRAADVLLTDSLIENLAEAGGEEWTELLGYAQDFPAKRTRPVYAGLESWDTNSWVYVLAEARNRNAAANYARAIAPGQVQRDGDIYYSSVSAATVHEGMLYIVEHENGVVDLPEDETPLSVLRGWLEGPKFDPSRLEAVREDPTPMVLAVAVMENVGNDYDPDTDFALFVSVRDEELALRFRMDNLADTFLSDVAGSPDVRPDLDAIPSDPDVVVGARVDLGRLMEEDLDLAYSVESLGFPVADLTAHLTGAIAAATTDVGSFAMANPEFTVALSTHTADDATALLDGRVEILQSVGIPATLTSVDGGDEILIEDGGVNVRISAPGSHILLRSSDVDSEHVHHPLVEEGFADSDALLFAWVDLNDAAVALIEWMEAVGEMPEEMPAINVASLQAESASVLTRVYAEGADLQIQIDFEGTQAIMDAFGEMIAWGIAEEMAMQLE